MKIGHVFTLLDKNIITQPLTDIILLYRHPYDVQYSVIFFEIIQHGKIRIVRYFTRGKFKLPSHIDYNLVEKRDYTE